MNGATVFIVDDDPSVRDATALLLGLNGFTTRLFASGEDFLSAFQDDWSGCLLLDLQMPGMSGLQLQQELSRRGAQLRIVVVTAHGDVGTARNALKSGAFDFLEKPVEHAVLLDVVRGALAAGSTAAPAAPPPRTSESRLERLTARERQVMEMLVRGRTHAEIGEALGISPRTVEVYRSRTMQKLRVENLAELIRLVVEAEGARRT